ncbi:DMT family transporter [Salarchaeum sp. III]|uniref:DMT family transporter n=1 Tax=Salarchaeum sp. III TaxID=3107927 RepID=UPI002ED8EF07
MNSRRYLGAGSETALLFCLLALAWGTSFVAIEVGLHHVPPLLFAGLRYVIAGAVLLAVALVTADRRVPRTRDEWLHVGVVATLVIGAYHGFLYLGEQHVPGAVAAVVISLTPVLTAPLASALLPDDSIGLVECAGLAFGVAGVAVIALPGSGVGSTSVLGVLFVFCGALSFALGSVASRPLDAGLPIQTTQAWAMLLGAGGLLIVGVLRGESLAGVAWNATSIGSLLYLSLVAGAGGYLLYFVLLDRASPTEINLVGYAEPAVATLVTWIALGHVVEETTLVGFAAILLGFALLKRRALLSVARATTRAAQGA